MVRNRSCWFTLAAWLFAVQTSIASAANQEISGLAEWLCQPTEERPELSAVVQGQQALNKRQSVSTARQLWQAYCQQMRKETPQHLMPQPSKIKPPQSKEVPTFEAKVGEKVMPIALVDKHGNEDSPALFICLHGGGSAGGGAPSPHGWPVNTREWSAQISLAQRVYQPQGYYSVPRMADDNDGRWWFSYCQQMYDRIIRGALATSNVDPNRVYLLGISEGGYGSFRLGAFMADRWAGVGPMAAGEPMGNAPPENLRNVAFRTEIGERDKTFNRVGMARDFHKKLEELHQNDPAGYRNVINVQAGRGHGVDYSQCPTWLAKHTRNPYPERVVWTVKKVHGVQRNQMYWLACDQTSKLPLYVEARLDREKQTIHLTVEQRTEDKSERLPAKDATLRIYLNDEMLNLEKEVQVLCNQEQVFQGKVERKLSSLARSLDERGDPSYMFPAEISVTLD